MRPPVRPEAIINGATGYTMGARVIEALRAEGWHLVHTPEWTENDKEFYPPMRVISLSAFVGDLRVDLSRVVSELQIRRGSSDYMHWVRERMVHEFGVQLVKALAATDSPECEAEQGTDRQE